ncbi:MAG: hypothetical protein ACFFC7_06550 [Candidatus Hermodarchaeota archaeon]
MTLNNKTRVSIIILIIMVFLGAYIANQLLIEIETPGDPNVKESYFFKTNHFASYRYRNASSETDSVLTIQGQVVNQTHTSVIISINETIQGAFFVDPNGFVYQNGTLQEGAYSIWWVFVPNVFFVLGINPGDSYDIIDPTGFLGISYQRYTMTVERKLVFWPYEPFQMDLEGAQASFEAAIFEESTHKKVATAILDMTCGVIEQWDGVRNGDWYTLHLTSTSFLMSRHRNIALIFDVIFGILLCGAVLLLTTKSWETPTLSRFTRPKEERNEIFLLVFTGIIAGLIEMIDIWFYLYLGLSGSLILHLGFVFWCLIICRFNGYTYSCAIPAFLEVSFVFALGLVTGEPFVPSLTAFMGSTISWLCLIWFSGCEKYRSE